MSKVLIQVWHDQKIWGEEEVAPDGDLGDAFDIFADALTALDAGESFTLIANRIS